jgi:Type IV secretion system pilin
MIKNILISCALFIFTAIGFSAVTGVSPVYAAGNCTPKTSTLGLPTWYKYLDGKGVSEASAVDPANPETVCQPQFSSISDVWKIVAAVIEILLRIAILVAIAFVVVGGITYTSSQGSPDKTKKALQTIISAIVGLVISIVASAVVGFIAGRF